MNLAGTRVWIGQNRGGAGKAGKELLNSERPNADPGVIEGELLERLDETEYKIGMIKFQNRKVR